MMTVMCNYSYCAGRARGLLPLHRNLAVVCLPMLGISLKGLNPFS